MRNSYLTTLWASTIGSFLLMMSAAVCALTPADEILKTAADQAYNESKLDIALAKYARLYHNNPDNDEIAYKLASSYYLTGAYSYATKLANELLSRDPDSVDGLMIQVQVSLAENRIDDAKTSLDAILDIDSHHAEAWRLLSDVLRRQSKDTEAEAAHANYLQYKAQ